MWLSAALLLTIVLILLEVFLLGHYDPPSTGRIQQLAYNTNHKQGATKLLKLFSKCLLMVTVLLWKHIDWEFVTCHFKIRKNNKNSLIYPIFKILFLHIIVTRTFQNRATTNWVTSVQLIILRLPCMEWEEWTVEDSYTGEDSDIN